MAQKGGGGKAQNTRQKNDKPTYALPGPAQANVNKTNRKPLSPLRLFKSVSTTGGIEEQSEATGWSDNHGLSQATGTAEIYVENREESNMQNEVTGANTGGIMDRIINSPGNLWRYATRSKRGKVSGNEKQGKDVIQG